MRRLLTVAAVALITLAQGPAATLSHLCERM